MNQELELKKNILETMTLYQKAADIDEPDAFYYIGNIYKTIL